MIGKKGKITRGMPGRLDAIKSLFRGPYKATKCTYTQVRPFQFGNNKRLGGADKGILPGQRQRLGRKDRCPRQGGSCLVRDRD